MGSFRDLKSNQALEPQIKHGLQMSSFKRCGCQTYPWNNKPKRHLHKENERQHTLQKYQILHDGLSPGISEIQSQRSPTHYL